MTSTFVPDSTVEQIEHAMTALSKFVPATHADSRDLLDDQTEWINLLVRFKKTPTFFKKFPLRMTIPSPFWNTEDFRICLIVWDRGNGRREERLKKELVPAHVTTVISAAEIRRLHKTAQQKRELCKAYDLFLLERSLAQHASKLLGGHFVKAKKFPCVVDLKQGPKNWRDVIELEKKTTQIFCYVHRDRSIRVGRSSFTTEQLVNNARSILNQLTRLQDKQEWDNIQQLFLYATSSPLLPVFQTFPDKPSTSEEQADGASGSEDETMELETEDGASDNEI